MLSGGGKRKRAGKQHGRRDGKQHGRCDSKLARGARAGAAGAVSSRRACGGEGYDAWKQGRIN
jgi:hypothetical protein